MNPFRVWRSVVVCIVALATGAAIQGCPPATPCPCEGEQEGTIDGEGNGFSIVGRWTASAPVNSVNRFMPWDTRTEARLDVALEIEFLSNGQYTLAFREKGVIVASESGTSSADFDSQPNSLDLNPTQASYPSTGPYSSSQSAGNPNLAVIEIVGDNNMHVGFSGSAETWGDVRPLSYAVADMRIALGRAGKSRESHLLSNYLRAMGL